MFKHLGIEMEEFSSIIISNAVMRSKRLSQEQLL